MKKLLFAGSALADIRNFPVEARREAGYQLSQGQLGFEPTDWKPIGSIGPGVREIRIHKQGGFRVIYITRFHEALYVLHAFQKKTRKISRKDTEMIKARLKMISEARS